MLPVIREIIASDWSLPSLLDYSETKGPSFYLIYAAIAGSRGVDLEVLRWVSRSFLVVAAFAACAFYGLARIPPKDALVAALAFIVLPYNLVLAQLFMSEAFFVAVLLLSSLCGMAALGPAVSLARRSAYLTCYALLLSIALHCRPHGVIWALAVCCVAVLAVGREAWPWILATSVVFAARMPLYLYWGGFAPPALQGDYYLGLSPQNLIYLLIASLPYTWVFLVELYLQGRILRLLPGLASVAILGVVVSAWAPPDLAATTAGGLRYMGPAASALRMLGDSSLTHVAICLLGVIAFVCVASVLVIVTEKARVLGLDRVALFSALVFAFGVGSQLFAEGRTFDRYLLPFVVLVPLLWVSMLSPKLLRLQFYLMVGISVLQIYRWLA